jgi:hemerythrin-like domain-containing protein
MASRPGLHDLVPSPAAGFEAPFAMLEACHERIGRTLDLLRRLREHVARHGADEQARQAARDVLRYFDLAAPQHHLDEERHVLPALEAAGDAAMVELAARLRNDHRRMEAAWADARAVLTDLGAGKLASLGPEQDGLLATFAALYTDHLAAEEGIAFPAASARLDAPDLERMSQDMRQRRGAA